MLWVQVIILHPCVDTLFIYVPLCHNWDKKTKTKTKAWTSLNIWLVSYDVPWWLMWSSNKLGLSYGETKFPDCCLVKFLWSHTFIHFLYPLVLDSGFWGVTYPSLHATPWTSRSLLQGNIERPKTIHAHSHSSFRVPSFSHVHSFGLWEEDGEPGASQPGANKWVVGESVNGFWAVGRSRRTWRKPTETQAEHANLRQQC